MQIKEIHKKPIITVSKEKSDDMMKKKRKEGERLVKGMFEFTDAQGGWLDFSIRFWPGESIKTIRIIHGEICDLPMDIVKHLNNTFKKVRQYDLSKTADEHPGRGIPRMTQKISRCRFTPMDVMV
jgi:hypothetical protein